MLEQPFYKKLVLIILIINGLCLNGYAQCPYVLLNETFDTGPVTGVVPGTIFGNGSFASATYDFNGTAHGWFNIINGLNNVDVYDRHIDACIGAEIEVSILIRRGNGGPNVNVDLIVEDDLGAQLTSVNLNLSNTMYELHTLNFTLLTSNGFNFIIHSNTAGSSAGGDIVTENLVITSDDNVLPTASNPAPLSVECITDAPIDPTVVIDEADNCTVFPVVAFVSDVSDGGLCPEIVTRTYSVTDTCGNAITVSHDITINDVTPPTASNPITTLVDCIANLPPPDPTVVIDEADNCTVFPVVAFVSEASNGGFCPEIITRIYSVTDTCGNTINVTHTINVFDLINPTASTPLPITVECIEDVPPPDILIINDEADNCTVLPVVAFVSDVSDGATCPETITRTYSVTDSCGNVLNVAQTITVNDITPPTASNPPPVTAECIAEVPVDPSVVNDEADNCTSVPIVAFVSDVSDGNTCPETITRTYSVTDSCGNFINVTQVITLNDITNPTASNPPDIVVDCTLDVPAPDPTVVVDAADNCSVPVVAFVSDVTDGNTCSSETLTRTYSVTDDCGNSINVTQSIIIQATTPNIDAGIDQDGCEGTEVVLTAINPDGAVISWDPAITDGTPFLLPVGSSSYTVTASICAGECTATDDVTININPTPIISFIADDVSGCTSETINFTNNSTETFECNWEFGDGNTSNVCNPVSHAYRDSGSFDVTLEVISEEGCSAVETYTEYIIINSSPIADFSYGPDDIDAFNTLVEFTNESLFSTVYEWDFGDDSPLSAADDPNHLYPEEVGGDYLVTLTATNDANCTNTIQRVVTIDEVLIYYVPNTFTPGQANINNDFKPVFFSGFDVYDYHLLIFNRWGEIVFESFDAEEGWDGTYNNQPCPIAAYVWRIDFGVTQSREVFTESGHVTLLK